MKELVYNGYYTRWNSVISLGQQVQLDNKIEIAHIALVKEGRKCIQNSCGRSSWIASTWKTEMGGHDDGFYRSCDDGTQLKVVQNHVQRWALCYRSIRNLLAVCGSTSLSLHTSMCFPGRDLHCWGFVRSISRGRSLCSFSLACPVKSGYCEVSPLSWLTLTLKCDNFITLHANIKIRKPYCNLNMKIYEIWKKASSKGYLFIWKCLKYTIFNSVSKFIIMYGMTQYDTKFKKKYHVVGATFILFRNGYHGISSWSTLPLYVHTCPTPTTLNF